MYDYIHALILPKVTCILLIISRAEMTESSSTWRNDTKCFPSMCKGQIHWYRHNRFVTIRTEIHKSSIPKMGPGTIFLGTVGRRQKHPWHVELTMWLYLSGRSTQSSHLIKALCCPLLPNGTSFPCTVTPGYLVEFGTQRILKWTFCPGPHRVFGPRRAS